MKTVRLTQVEVGTVPYKRRICRNERKEKSRCPSPYRQRVKSMSA
jgi:hypothetical protein